MPKLSLTPAPTFKGFVSIPIPGSSPAKVQFTFRHRNRDEIKTWMDEIEGKPMSQVVLEAASGWDLEEPFDAEHVELLLKNYIGSGQAVLETYLRELSGAREKN